MLRLNWQWTPILTTSWLLLAARTRPRKSRIFTWIFDRRRIVWPSGHTADTVNWHCTRRRNDWDRVRRRRLPLLEPFEQCQLLQHRTDALRIGAGVGVVDANIVCGRCRDIIQRIELKRVRE